MDEKFPAATRPYFDGPTFQYTGRVEVETVPLSDGPCAERKALLGGENPSWVCITSPGYCHAIQISPEEQRKLAAEAAAHSDWRLAMLD